MKVSALCSCVLAVLPILTACSSAQSLGQREAGFCPTLVEQASRTCIAKYNCAPGADRTRQLSEALCGCLTGKAPDHALSASAVNTLAAQTPEFACCAGNAYSARPELCDQLPQGAPH